MHASEDVTGPRELPAIRLAGGSASATVLAWMAFLVPTAGVPSELLLQDTLKSAVLAFGTLIAAWIFVWERRKHDAPVHWHGLLAVPLVLMVYAVGSMVWSHAYLAGVEAIRWFLLSVLIFLGLNTFDRESLPKLLWGIHAGVVVASFWAASQFWWSWDGFPQAAVPGSSFANRNFFAEYAVAVFPLSVWLLASLKPSRWLVWVALSIAFNLVAILMTGTRSALIALCVIAPILILVVVRMRAQLAFTGWRRPRQALVALVLLLGLAILGSWPTDNPKIVQEGRGNTALERSFQRTASMAQGTEYTEGSFSVRSTMWMATARMMLANPWAGVGAGAWEVQIPLYQRTDTTLETDYYAHNETLQLLSEYGLLVGGLCLAFLWAYLIKAASTTWHLPRATSQEGPLRAVVLTSLLAQLIVSNAGFPWHLAGGGMLLALCLGLLSGSDLRLRAIAGGIYDSKAVLRYSYSALTLVSICLALALHWTWQAASAERHIVRAVQLAAKITRASNKGEAFSATDRDTMLEHIRSGIDITPHYRRFTALVAEPLTAIGDCVNAVWILNSVVRSRPHVVVLWAALAKCESQLGHHDRAQWALKEVQRLKPDAVATGTLAVRLLANREDFERASQLAGTLFMAGNFDWELTEWAYALGYKTANWQLAIRALELRNARWPQQSADGHLRLGKIYAEPLKDADRAVAEFKAGMAAVPSEQRADYIRQVPDPFKAQIE